MRSRFSWQRHPVAKALYDNVAEAPDELAFRKGDVLAVLEQNTAGLEGWWLCYHRGRQVTRRRFRSERRPRRWTDILVSAACFPPGPDVAFEGCEA